MNAKLSSRAELATHITRQAADLAMTFYREPARLHTRNKGIQDQVSEGDIAVEKFIREQISTRFPGDGVIGEEEGDKTVSQSGYTWVIDPIDGTSNFVRSAPGWCVVVCLVDTRQTLLGVICDPIADECFVAVRGNGSTLNGKTIQTSASTSLADGSVGVGMSNRVPTNQVVRTIERIVDAEGLFYRSGSGALNLAYVAAGRLSGYCEPHMNAWDCLAGMLLIEEAGGYVERFDIPIMLRDGGRVIAGCPGVYDTLQAICDETYVSPAAVSNATEQ